MLTLGLALTMTMAADTVTLEERVHRYDPSTGAFLGAERTWYGPDGRRLRLEETGAEGEPLLVFMLLHHADGRERGALYIEEGADSPTQEVFTYSPDGSLMTTTYYYEPGVPSERTESFRDADGRETHKRYYRADGTQYGEEDVLWDEAGRPLGWDFRRVGREGGASFRFAYEDIDDEGRWRRRVRMRDGSPERVETRTRVTTGVPDPLTEAVPFAPGRISTGAAETSPSFSADGRTMVFARYGEDWDQKTPYVAYLEEDGWRVEALTGLGPVYNLALSPDGRTLVYAVRSGNEERTLYRVELEGDGQPEPENLTAAYGVEGTYPALTEEGHLLLFDAEGSAGSGVYLARRQGAGFAAAAPFYTPPGGTTFDAHASTLDGPMLVARCLDDVCASNGVNGIWEVELRDGAPSSARVFPGLPYAWGVQAVPALGILVFTDGDDILAVPLASAGTSAH